MSEFMGSDDRDLTPPQSRPTKGGLRARFEDKQDKLIDDAMSKGDSWAKKIRNKQQGVLLDDIPHLLAFLGLKIVDSERTCITPRQLEHYKACEVIAAGALNPSLKDDWDPE